MSDINFYYLIIFSIILTLLAYIYLLFIISTLKLTINIPYIFLILLIFSYIILIYISIYKKYIIHSILYIIMFIILSIITILKITYDKNEIV